MKTCASCKKQKPIECFSKDSTKKDGLKYSCKECRIKQKQQNHFKKTAITCKICGETKPPVDFSFGESVCKPCKVLLTKQNKEQNRDRDRLWRKANKRILRYQKHGVDLPSYIAQDDDKFKQFSIDFWKNKNNKKEDKLIEKIVEQNARQAWEFFIKQKASDEWMSSFYEETGKPWSNPRITNTEKFAIRYKLDKKFAIKERIRNQLKKKSSRFPRLGDLMRDALKRKGKSNTIEKVLGYSVDDLSRHLEKQFTKGMSWDKFKKGEIHIDHIVPLSTYNLNDVDEVKKAWCLSNLRPLWDKDNIKKSNRMEYLL